MELELLTFEFGFDDDGCSALSVFVAFGAEDAADAEAGAGVEDGGAAEPFTPATPLELSPLAELPPLPPSAGTLLAGLVGDVMSIGSVGDGADIWILGVGTGTTRAGPGCSGPSATIRFR